MPARSNPPRPPEGHARLLKEAARCRTLAAASSPTLAAELLREAERLESAAARLV